MSGWHPNAADGGVLPNPGDSNNPANAFNPVRPPIATAPLYYGNGCDVRLRPAVLNSLISENLSLVDSVGLSYNPSSLINVRTAVEYVVQKGVPKYAVVTPQGTPATYFRGLLTPPLLGGYNNGMILCVIPTERNVSWVRIDLGNGGPWTPVLRDDMEELEQGDWPANVPQIIAFYNGAFYMLGPVLSQIPLVLKGTIEFWVRPDGNDTTGDGSANLPEKAFRTIMGCWAAIGSRYTASPTAHIAIKLGVAGDYEGAFIGPWGAALSVTGDVNNPLNYRIHSRVHNAGNQTHCVHAQSVSNFMLVGVTLNMDMNTSTPNANRGLSCDHSSLTLLNVNIDLTMNHTFWSIMLCSTNSTVNDWVSRIGTSDPASTIRFIGRGNTVDTVMNFSGSFTGDGSAAFFKPCVWSFESIKIQQAPGSYSGYGLLAENFSTVGMGGNRSWVQSGCTGKRYAIGTTTNVWLGGKGLPPGDQAGVLGTFSTYTT